MQPDHRPECFNSSVLTQVEHEAIRNLYSGQATEYQQRLVLEVIVKKFCRTYDTQFVAGSPDQTAFLNGRAFVGHRILRAINLPVGALEYEEAQQ